MGARPPARSWALPPAPGAGLHTSGGTETGAAPCQERWGLTYRAPAQSKVRDSRGVFLAPRLSPRAAGTRSGVGKAVPPLRPLLLSASLAPSACGHVTAAWDSVCCALVQTGLGLREAGPGVLRVSGATTQALQVAPPCSRGAAGVRVRRLRTDTPYRFMGNHS